MISEPLQGFPVSTLELSLSTARSVMKRVPAHDLSWHYEHGLMIMAIDRVGRVYGDEACLEYAREWLDKFVTKDGEILTYRKDEHNLDQINPGRVLFPLLHDRREPRFEKALDLLHDQLLTQPKTPSGAYWHKKIYPNQLWLDGVYMAEPFSLRYALHSGRPENYLGTILLQFRLAETKTRDPVTGLLYHAWDESRTQLWSNPETGCSPHFWGRAMGWYAMALVDVLDFWPEDRAGRSELVGILERLFQAARKVQDHESGLWYQVLDLGTRTGNYLESSVSSMFSYAFFKAARKGLLDDSSAVECATRAWNGLLSKKVTVGSDGGLNLNDICSVAGLGGKPYRDGSFDYYISERKVANDFKGLGPFILAALEVEAGNTKNVSLRLAEAETW